MTLIQDRADIEKHYAKSLKAWAKKWHELIDKGPEYGTTQAGWKSLLTEADRVADLHLHIKEQLVGDVQSSIKTWRAENYHKPMVGPCKETKELEDRFRKAQKPWAKRLGKVMKTKKDYHTACKLEKSATNQENNARVDSSLSADQLKKLQDKVEKCKKDVEMTQEKYRMALNDLNGYNAKYMEDMSEVFQKSQEYEHKRLKFFKEMLFGIHKSLNLSDSQELGQIYDQLYQTISIADCEKDLKWWSNNHGVDMAMHWPIFEEYSPEMHSIHKKKLGGSSNDGVMLTALHKNDNGMPGTPTLTSATSHNSQPEPQQRPASSDYSAGYRGYDNTAATEISNPFGDDDEWHSSDAPDYEGEYADLGEPVQGGGVRVRALYNYTAGEDDEISFSVGDEFTKLRNRNKQGWCFGDIAGRKGLYPDNYVEIIDK